jgi:hypothetical protein
MTTQEKHQAFMTEIALIESNYRDRLLFPISYYFEWRVFPYNLVYDTTKVLNKEIKDMVIAKYNAIYR